MMGVAAGAGAEGVVEEESSSSSIVNLLVGVLPDTHTHTQKEM